MHIWFVSVLSFIAGAAIIPEKFRDECGWHAFYLGMVNTDYFCNERGMCEDALFAYVTHTSCEAAARYIAHSRGSVLLEETADGQLHEVRLLGAKNPHYVRSLHEMPVNDNVTNVLFDTTQLLIRSIGLINDELDFWAPRVLYVPERIQGTLQAARQAVLTLQEFLKTDALADVIFTSQVALLKARIVDYGRQLLGVSDIRSNGYLQSFIPFAHFHATLTFSLANSDGSSYEMRDRDLITTISQFHPMYFTGPPEWMFRINDSSSPVSPLEECGLERFLVPMGPKVEHRHLLDLLGSLGCGYPLEYSNCRASISMAIDSLQTRVFKYSTREGALAELHKSVLALHDHTHSQAFRSHLLGIARRILREVGRNRMFLIRSVSAVHFQPFDQLDLRISWAFSSSMSYYGLPVAIQPGVTAMAFVSQLTPQNLHTSLMSQADGDWVDIFFRTEVLRHITPRMSPPVLDSSLTRMARRCIGRVLAYALWRGDVQLVNEFVDFHLSNPVNRDDEQNYIDYLFMGSKHVRFGFYEWFRYPYLEQAVRIRELPEALRLIQENPIWTKS